MYCVVTVKNTGESISELEANTLVDNTCLDCGPIFCIFHCELPKILTELDCDVSETARLVIELGLLPILLLLIVKFRSCTFPAASWIRGGEDLGGGEGGSSAAAALFLVLFFVACETTGTVSAVKIAVGNLWREEGGGPVEDIEETLVRLNEDVEEGKGETEGETLSPGEILSP